VREEEGNSGKKMEEWEGGGKKERVPFPEFSSSFPTPSPLYACYASYLLLNCTLLKKPNTVLSEDKCHCAFV